MNNFSQFIDQKNDMCCFVWAVANYQIFKNKEIPDLEEAREIAKCNTGATINQSAVIEYFNADLKRHDNTFDVLNYGGIIPIWHPIVNGHALLVILDEENGIWMINSWLGPTVINTSKERIYPFLPETRKINIGSSWISPFKLIWKE